MGLGGLIKSITKPISSAVKSISDIPGSINNFVKNPVDSLGTGIGNFYMAPGRAIGSDSLTNLGGAFGAATGGMLLGPNGGKAAGEASGTSSLGQAFGRGTVGTIAGLSALYGLGAMGGGAAGAGTNGFASGQGLMGSGGVSSLTSAPAYAGTGASTVPAFGGMAGSAAPYSIYGSVPASSSFLDSLSGGLGSIGDKISNMSGKDWLGVGDLGARLWQMNQMNNIAEEAANKGDALSQPQRIPYQKLLSDYLTGNQDITEQPYVKSNMDFAMKQARANMAKKGTTGAGGAERELLDYANNAYNSTALPYLQQLSGMAGFGFGPGYAGNLYGQYASQASAAPSMILNDIGRLYGYNQNNQTPWQSKANNAQIQLSGLGPGMNTPVY